MKGVRAAAGAADTALLAKITGETAESIKAMKATNRAAKGRMVDLMAEGNKIQETYRELKDVTTPEAESRKSLLENQLKIVMDEIDARRGRAKVGDTKHYNLEDGEEFVYTVPRKRADLVYPKEVAKDTWQALKAEAQRKAPITEVNDALMKLGYEHRADYMKKLRLFYETKGEQGAETMADFQRLSPRIQAHFDKLGATPNRVLRALSLEKGAELRPIFDLGAMSGYEMAKERKLYMKEMRARVAARVYKGETDAEQVARIMKSIADGGSWEDHLMHMVPDLDHKPVPGVVGKGINVNTVDDPRMFNPVRSEKEAWRMMLGRRDRKSVV